MNLLAEKIVPAGFVIACLFAGVPTIIFPSLWATIEGVVLLPSAFGITFASPHSMKATQEFVVPRSIQIIFHIFFKLKFNIFPPICLSGIFPPKGRKKIIFPSPLRGGIKGGVFRLTPHFIHFLSHVK